MKTPFIERTESLNALRLALRAQLDLLTELRRNGRDAAPLRGNLDVVSLAEQLTILVPEQRDLVELVRIYAHEDARGRAGAPERVLMPLLERRLDLEASMNKRFSEAERLRADVAQCESDGVA